MTAPAAVQQRAPRTETANSSLHQAKRAKNDEFYTQLGDIEAEVGKYWNFSGPPENHRNPFEGKTVFMNCDDPQQSNFWRYFVQQFDFLKINRLIATHYEMDGSPSYAMFLERDAAGKRIDLGVDGRGIPLGRILGDPSVFQGQGPRVRMTLRAADGVK